MSKGSRAFCLLFVILAACVPENTAGEAAFEQTRAKAAETAVAGTEKAVPEDTPAVYKDAEAQKERKQGEALSFSPEAIGPYMLYLQAKQDGDFSNAVKFLSDAVKADPDNRRLVSEMFALLTVEGRLAEAFPYAEAELKNDPDSVLAALVVVSQNVKEERYDRALAVLENFPNKRENAFLVPLLEAWVYIGMKQPETALKTLEAVNGRGTEALYVFHKALMSDMLGDSSEAEDNYELLLREPGGLSLRAAQTYGNLLLRKKDAKKFAVLMEAYKNGSRSYPLTDKRFFTAGADPDASFIPMNVPSAQSGMAEAFFDVSGSLAGKGSVESALFFIRFALDLDPQLSLGRVLLGELLETQGRQDDALALYEADTEESEIYFATRMRAADLLAKKGEVGRAAKILQSLADKRNDLALPYIAMGDILLTDKQYGAAADAYTEAIKRIPEPRPQHWTLFYSRGVANERRGNARKAENDFLKALSLSPEQPLALNYLGYFWLEQGKNIQKAKGMLERAVFRAPNEGFIADSLGWAYYLLKDYRRSVPVLETAVSLDPGSAVINDHLGDAYWRNGRKREARFQWRKALDVNDDFSAGDRERTEAKLKDGLDVVGDKLLIRQEDGQSEDEVKTSRRSGKKKGGK